MKLYRRSDGKDIWAEHEPDEELQVELAQLENQLLLYQARVTKYQRLIDLKKEEIAAQKLLNNGI